MRSRAAWIGQDRNDGLGYLVVCAYQRRGGLEDTYNGFQLAAVDQVSMAGSREMGEKAEMGCDWKATFPA